MEWSNLNEQMIEQIFQNSNSPSNAQYSLNFSRTSRQNYSNQKTNRDNQNHNPQIDLLLLTNQQISNIQLWISNLNKKTNRTSINQTQEQIKKIQNRQLKQIFCQNYNHNSSIQQSKQLKINLINRIDQFQTKIKSKSSVNFVCQNCTSLNKKHIKLQTQLKQLHIQLQIKQQQIQRINQIQINKLGQTIPIQVQNSLYRQKIQYFTKQNQKLNSLILLKDRQLSKFNEQIQKFNLQKSTYYFKNKTLQNRLLQMQKSKTFLLSAAKNSTTHSDFNITNSNTNINHSTMIKSNNNQTNHTNDMSSLNNHNDISSLININQFNCQKSVIQPDQFIIWLQKIKQTFLQKYRKQQKQHLLKNHILQLNVKNDRNAKQLISNFKKGNHKYELARSCKNLIEYIKKNKQNFLQIIGSQQMNNNKNVSSKDKYLFMHSQNNQKSSLIEQYEQQLKKAHKLSQGLECQISNLQNQLKTIRKTLMKQKQEKQNTLIKLHQQKQFYQNKIAELQKNNHPKRSQQLSRYNNKQQYQQYEYQLALKSQQISKLNQEIMKLSTKNKKNQESQQKTQLLIKQLQYLLYKQRKQKIKYYQLFINFNTLVACRIRNKNIEEKHLQIAVHQFQGRIHMGMDNQKYSFKYDIIQNCNKKNSNSQILTTMRKIIQNLFYNSSSSLIVSLGSIDSQYRQLIRNQKGLFLSCINQIFKLKQTQKRYIQTSLNIQIIQLTNNKMIDLLDLQKSNRKLQIKKDNQRIYVSNCNILNIEGQKQAKQIYLQALQNQSQQESNIVMSIDFNFTDKRTKQKYQSKLFFCQMNLLNHINSQSQQKYQYLFNDNKSLWNALYSINFNQYVEHQKNRLTYLLSECLQQNSKNLVIINVSPTQNYKEQSLNSLKYGSSFKSLITHNSNNSFSKNQQNQKSKIEQLQKNKRLSNQQIPIHSYLSNKQLKQIPKQQSQLHSSPYFANKSFTKGGQQKYLQQKSYQLQNKLNQQKNPISRHRNSNSQLAGQSHQKQKKKRTISRLSIC